MTIALYSFEEYEVVKHECDLLRKERSELLQVLFQPLRVRQAVAKRLLGADDSLQKPSTKPVHSRQGQ